MHQLHGADIDDVATRLFFHLPDSCLCHKIGSLQVDMNVLVEILLGVFQERFQSKDPGIVRTLIYGDADVDAFGGVALVNRVGEVQEITEAVLHLATASFTTGVIIPVDGGYVYGRS